MGGTISQAANGLGNAIGNALSVPFKSIFGGTCEDVCTGPFDIICFIEHICVVNLLKLFIICFLSYITLLFLYLLFKLGVFQCVGRSLCRCCWTTCETYWSTLGHVSCLMWHKLINTKRVYRGRRRRQLNHAREAHGEYIVKDESDYSNAHLGSDRKRKFTEDIREGHGVVRRQKSNQHHRHHHHHSHRHHHHRPQSDVDMGTKRVTMGLRRWRSSRDHHEHHHHSDTGGEVDRRLSFKRHRVDR